MIQEKKTLISHMKYYLTKFQASATCRADIKDNGGAKGAWQLMHDVICQDLYIMFIARVICRYTNLIHCIKYL